MFNIFRKKQASNLAVPNDPGAAGAILIVTATTNFGLVVSPANKEPLMFTLEPNDSIPACVERNAPYISSAIDVASCLVIELAAHLPNQAQTATNKIFALILPDPGILLNHDMVLVGYEELERIPGPTSSMLQMLVKQVPKEYFAEPSSSLENKNNPTPAPAAPIVSQEVVEAVPLATIAPVVADKTVEPAGFDSAPVSSEQLSVVEQPIQPIEPEALTVADAEVAEPVMAPEAVEPTGFDSSPVTSPELVVEQPVAPQPLSSEPAAPADAVSEELAAKDPLVVVTPPETPGQTT